MNANRQVHGTVKHGALIVRYERAGKWYLEYPAVPLQHSASAVARGYYRRRPLTLRQAAVMASEGTHRPGLPGGRILDAIVARMSAEGASGD